MEEKKKIIVFYGSFGGGHLSAAKAIKSKIEEKYKYEVILEDALELVNKVMNNISVSFYNLVSKKFPNIWGKMYKDSNKENTVSDKTLQFFMDKYKKKLLQNIQEINPEYIICTHPFASIMCTNLKKTKKLDKEIYNIITDFEIHTQWYVNHEYMDGFFVSTEDMKSALIEKGVKKEKIYVTGIPIRKEFETDISEKEKEEIKKEYNIPGEKSVAIFAGGGEFGLSSKSLLEIFKKAVSNFKDTHFICISGKNEKLYQTFKKIIEEEKFENVTLVKYTEKMADVMKISKFIISKPGGLTTSEALALKLPFLMINPIPGQEEANREYIEKIGAGIYLDPKNFEEKLNEIRDEKILEKMSKNAGEKGHRFSTENILDIIIKEEK